MPTGRGIGAVVMLYQNTDQVGCAASSANTTLDTFPMGAATMGRDGDSIEFEYGGTFGGDTGVRLRVYWGTDLVLDTDVIDPAISGWAIYGRVVRTGAATQKVTCWLGSLGAGIFTTTSCTQTLSAAVALELRGLGVAANDVVKESAVVRFCGAPS